MWNYTTLSICPRISEKICWAVSEIKVFLKTKQNSAYVIYAKRFLDNNIPGVIIFTPLFWPIELITEVWVLTSGITYKDDDVKSYTQRKI